MQTLETLGQLYDYYDWANAVFLRDLQRAKRAYEKRFEFSRIIFSPKKFACSE